MLPIYADYVPPSPRLRRTRDDGIRLFPMSIEIRRDEGRW